MRAYTKDADEGVVAPRPEEHPPRRFETIGLASSSGAVELSTAVGRSGYDDLMSIRRLAVRGTFLAVSASLVLACASTTKYTLAESPQATASGDASTGAACVASCQRGTTFALRKKNRQPVYDYDCLQRCPGLVVREGECEEHEKAPGSFCVEKYEKGAGAEIIGGTIGLVLVVGAIAAAASR